MRKKVMIVEDNALNLKLFTDLLRAHQFTVEGVRDGRLALERALSFAPDLVIMDIRTSLKTSGFWRIDLIHWWWIGGDDATGWFLGF